MSLGESAHRFGCLAQTMAAVDHRPHLPRLEESAQGDQILVSAIPNKPDGYLTVTETQASATVFDSNVGHQAVPQATRGYQLVTERTNRSGD